MRIKERARSASVRIASSLDPFLQQAAGEIFPAAAVHLCQHGETIYRQAFGRLEPAASPTTQASSASPETRFDLASLTKLFTTTAFLRLVAAGEVGLDQSLADVLPTFSGERAIRPYEDPLRPGQFIFVESHEGDPYCREGATANAGEVTFRHLLTHTSGLPAWRPFFRKRSDRPSEAIAAAILESFFAYPPGARVVYSDLGFMLLGLSIAKLTSRPLDSAMRALVFEPLGNLPIQYGPVLAEQAAPTEQCPWRGRRIRGEVHDENSWAMGGVAGHAGLFGTAEAVAALGQAWLADCQGANRLLPPGLAAEATRQQAQDGVLRRGLGWAVWSPDPDSAGHPLSSRAFGHTGFTGTSLYVDPDRELVVACLTNELYWGRQERKIGRFRVELHKRVLEAL